MGTKKRKVFITIKVELDTYKVLKTLAKRQEQSLSQVIISLVEKHNGK